MRLPLMGRRNERTLALRALLVCALILVIPARSGAELQIVDLFAAGDGLITRDTVTGLDWLDLTETRDLSFDDIVGGAGGWTAMGFRHAITAEVCDLFDREFFAPSPCPTDGDFLVPGDHLDLVTQYFGQTGVGPSTGGMYDDGTPENGVVGWGTVDYISPKDATDFFIVDDALLTTYSGYIDGNYLVRYAPVSIEPHTWGRIKSLYGSLPSVGSR